MENILVVRHLTKTYETPSRSLTVLDDVSFEIRKGETLSIVGTSGSGKTTLLGLCAGLDLPSKGDVELAGVHLGTLDEDERARLRNQKVGFIFQDFQLIPTLTALENVALPLELQGVEEAFQRAKRLLDRVGLGDRIHHYPNELSGGEQQRVSLARAFSNEPTILFADEPTGNLDEDTSEKVEDLIFELNREAGTTLVLVTHDLDLASRTERVIRLKGGRLVSDNTKANV
jgi:putative ABC transport system ATP-binding protein